MCAPIGGEACLHESMFKHGCDVKMFCFSPGGVLGISSDGDDRMEPKVKTQKNPWTKN